MLQHGVPEDGELRLVATLEDAQAAWLPDEGSVSVPFRVPDAGATREEGLVAVGADATFQVLETDASGLVAVGAGELTARGIEAAGLVYGYRLDGESPALRLDVRRHTPRLEAQVVTIARPTPRRLELTARIIHRIERAGVRRLEIDVPAWTGEDVRFETPLLRAAHRLPADSPVDVPPGFTRWLVDLDQRLIGRHAMTVSYYLDQETEDWRVGRDVALCPRVPVRGAERVLVVERADGLEVDTDVEGSDVRALDVTELPREAAVDPLEVLEVVRLSNGANGLALSVRKHDGAAVLDVIATQVRIETAVASEGILRSRAAVVLVNVGRQFLPVRLPDGSELIGAIVDDKPVKPLVREDGTLLVPIPTARTRDRRTVAAITWETNLGAAIDDEVEIVEPRFPDVEVLETRHVVAFEPGLRIESVDGDLSGEPRGRRDHRAPWISVFAALGGRALDASAPGADVTMDAAPAPGARPRVLEAESAYSAERDYDVEIDDHVETDNDLPFEESTGLSDRAFEVPPTEDPGASITPASRPRPGRGVPAAPEPEPGSELPAADGPDHGRVGHGGEGPIFGAEGETFEREPRSGRTSRRRKGLLSLDVPVWLAPNKVATHRLGAGGSMHITLRPDEGQDRSWLGFFVAFVALLLGVGTLGRAWRWGAIFAVLAVAATSYLIAGEDAATLVVAGIDAATGVAALYGLYWIGRFVLRTTAPSAAAALLVVAASLGASAPAHADEPRPPLPQPREPGTVYLPYDPADPASIDAHDRVFLPLEQYLALYKTAHPEADPEVVRLGRYVTAVDAEYVLDVTGDLAEATLRFRLAKRGEGTKLVGLPIAGLSVVEARLDGEPVRLLLDRGRYRVALETEGDHELVLTARLPVVREGEGRTMAFRVPAFARARVDVSDPGFRGDLRVSGAGRVTVLSTADDPVGFVGRAFLGRVHDVRIRLEDPPPDALPQTVVTRAELKTVHSVRDDGTETMTWLQLHVLQGRAPFVDLDLAEGERVLHAGGDGVVRWVLLEDHPNRVRLEFEQRIRGGAALHVRTFRESATGDRQIVLRAPRVVGTTGERGRVIVNADPAARIEVLDAGGLFRVGRPEDEGVHGPDGTGRVVGAWTYASRYGGLEVRVSRAVARLEVESLLTVVFGDDHVRSRFDALVSVRRTPVGRIVFALPGSAEVREVVSGGLRDWWLTGEGDDRRLHLRYDDLRIGDLAVRVSLERRLGGMVDGIAVPRIALEDAQRDRGRLILYALPEVEPSAGAVAGLRSIPLSRANPPAAHVPRAEPVSAFAWERPVEAALPVVLRAPTLELRSTSVTLVAPSDEAHRLEHLLLFDVRRGATDRLRFFLPDGGDRDSQVVRTRDLREMREQRVTRRGADGGEVAGTLYDLRLQAPRGGLIEVVVSQRWDAGRPVRFVAPEDVSERRFFAVVRTFIDGSVAAVPFAGRPEEAVWADLPFVPAGLDRTAVVKVYDSREPFALRVVAERQTLVEQAGVVVQAAVANVVVGRDGYARVRISYRIFNRSRQFLRVVLPETARLFGATAAGQPVKPLGGASAREILVPIPKVPLGGTGRMVTLLFRSKVGGDFEHSGDHRIVLPELPGIDVDRTVVQLRVPDGYGYDFDTEMVSAAQADVAADLAEAAIREARSLLQIAEKGTLGQRYLSAQNAQLLIQEAEALTARDDVKRERPTLQDDVASLRARCAVTCGKVRTEWAEAQQDQTLALNPSQTDFAGNAAQLIEGQGQARQQGLNKAAWLFNDAGEESTREDIAKLKQQLAKGLQDRAAGTAWKRSASEQRANDARVGQTRQLEEQTVDKNVRDRIEGRKSGSKARDDTEASGESFYDARNFDALNRRLKRAQERSNQVGANLETQQVAGNAEGLGDAPFDGPAVNGSIGMRSTPFQGPANNGSIGYTDLYNSNFVGQTYEFRPPVQGFMLFAGDGDNGRACPRAARR